MICLKEFFEKVDFEKNQQTTKSMKKYPTYKELIIAKNITGREQSQLDLINNYFHYILIMVFYN